MAKDTLGDRPPAVNIPTSPFRPTAEHYPQTSADWLDYVQDNLDKARALITVAQWGQGLDSCSESNRHDYLLVIEELLDAVAFGAAGLKNIASSGK